MKTLIATATKLGKAEFSNTRLAKSLQYHKDNTITKFDLKVTYNNTAGLCSVYNKYLVPKFLDNYDCILFIHDDVSIDSLFFQKSIRNLFKKGFDIVGLAGGSNIQVKKPALWHLLCNPESLSGVVSHYTGKENYGQTIFGQVPKEVILLDGLFLAVRTKSIKQTKIKFDRNITGFHHYDLKFCLDCHLAGLRLTTAPIHVIHDSPGLTQFTEEYSKSEDYFYNTLVEHANKRK